MRTFTASTAFTHNAAWRDALGADGHIVQFPLLIVAATKQEAIDMLVNMGESLGGAEGLVKATKATKHLGNDWDMLVDDGVIDLDAPGVYFCDGARRGSKAIKVTGRNSAQVLGEFIYDPTREGRAIYFVPA